MDWSNFQASFGDTLRLGSGEEPASDVMKTNTDSGDKHWEELRKRIVEHVRPLLICSWKNYFYYNKCVFWSVCSVCYFVSVCLPICLCVCVSVCMWCIYIYYCMFCIKCTFLSSSSIRDTYVQGLPTLVSCDSKQQTPLKP